MTSPTIVPVSADRWDDLETLFGPNGAYSNCWCTWFLLSSRQWDDAGAAGRRELLAGQVAEGREPGLLAYDGDEPVGWCAVGPRERYARFTSPRARVYKAVDDEPSWVVSCFFIRKDRRGTGVASALLEAAVAHAAEHGATVVEGYPIDRETTTEHSAASLYVGTRSMFATTGFTEAARHEGRPVMRRRV